MSEKIIVTRWVDLEAQELKEVEYYSYIKKVIASGLEHGIITSDSDGCLFMDEGTVPIHAEIKGQIIGIRLSKKAYN